MELNEFKDMFDKTSNSATQTSPDIAAIIYLDTKGPLATLERKLKLSIYIFAVVVVLFVGNFLFHGHRALTWYLLYAILFIEFIFSVFQYGVIKQIRSNTGDVKHNLTGKLNLLQKIYQWFLPVHEGLFLLMAVLLEISMYYHLDINFEGWSKVNPVLRIAAYALFLTGQYLLKRSTLKKHYLQYLEKLQNLVKQL